VILALVAVSVAGLSLPRPHVDFLYWRTITGAFLGLLLIFFGQPLQRALLRLAKRSRRDDQEIGSDRLDSSGVSRGSR
jgi:hypothetical protein